MSRWLRPLLMLIGLALVGYLVAQIGPAAIWASFVTLGWRLPLVLAFPYALAAAVDTFAWRLLLPTPVPFLFLLRARLAGEAVSLATPTMSVGGDPLKAYLLRPRLPLRDGFVSVIADKTTVVAGQVLFLALGLLAAYLVAPPAGRLLPIMTGLLVLEVLAVGGFALVQATGALGGGGRLLGRLARRVGVGGAERFEQGLGDLDRALAALYRHRRRRLVASAIVHAVAWATGGLEIYLVLSLLGTPAPLGIVLIVESFASGVKFASFMVPASLGALEGGYMVFFEAFGLGAAAGLSYVLVRRLREITWAVVGFLALGAERPRA
ncbi:MAG TPA: flippase-like domain-containing protein [Candidatus Limnocylindria bacterium]|nr:flippase-like domain-containing protein [Candidatus Limnocylindria bacterium]